MRFWKEFEFIAEKGKLLTPYTCHTVKRSLDYIRPIKFFPQMSCDYFGTVMIEGGCIHAFYKQEQKHSVYSNYILVPIIVESDDVIAFGRNLDVCFLRYKISNNAWNHIEKVRTEHYKHTLKILG